MNGSVRSPLLAFIAAALVIAGPAVAAADSIGVIVHTTKPYGAVVAGIEALGGTVTYQYQNADGLAAQIPAGKLGDLQALAGVAMVEKDYEVQVPAPRELATVDFALEAGDLLDAGQLGDMGIEPANYYSYLSAVTGAEDTWADTGAGADTIVAVIDSGTQASHVCFGGRVIAGPDFSTDAGGPFEGSTLPTNGFHGTFVGGQVASNCGLVLPAAHPIAAQLPPESKIDIGGGLVLIPLFGIAPQAEIYAVKVFPHTGGGTSTARINAAIDHVISQKVSGALDVDVVNMSIGGASLNDGKSFNEKLVDAATDAGLVMAIAAGNDGPAPTTVSRAGTAYSAVTVGAATDPVHTRVFWEFTRGAGAGATLYAADELRIMDFSGQGPYADGRQGPDIIATGVFNFGPTVGSGTGLAWSSGTSFATPQVAGAAALLNAWAENNAPGTTAAQIRNALFAGAAPMASEWGVQSQGNGFLNVPGALAALQAGTSNGIPHASSGGKLKPNIRFDKNGEYSTSVTLERGRWVSWVFAIDSTTEKVIVDVDPVGGAIPPGPSGAYGFAESFELYVKSAKRGGIGNDFVDSANVFDDASAEISAGSVVLAGGIAGNLVSVPPATLEPGLMKVVLQSDWTNNTQFLSADVKIKRIQGAQGNNAGGVTSTLGDLETQVFAFAIPAGTTRATFDLSWKHDWTKVPTNDLDLLFVSPSSFPFLAPFFDGATLNSPERQIIDNPEAGTWFILVDGFQVQQGRDPYVLEVTLE